MNKKSFIKSAAVLGTAGVIVKIIGVLYKIPLINIIGFEGTGLYYKAYPIYTVLLMLSTAGLPPAISKLVSQHVAKGDKAGAQRIFKVALVLLGVFGLLCSLILFLFSKNFAQITGSPLVEMSIRYIAPAVFFVSVMAAIRGYFQGLQNMFPTAMTQMVEQLGKVILGLTFATVMYPKGVEYGAAGAVIGVMLSEVIAMIVIVIYYFVKREKIPQNAVVFDSVGRILKNIIKFAIPILIGASIMPIVQFSDSIIITARLESIGYAKDVALSVYGIFSAGVNTLVNVPGTVSLAFCVSILPVISATYASESYDALKRNTKMGFKMAMLVGIPSAVGLGVIATPIMNLLYGKEFIGNDAILAGELLMIIAGGVIFLSILQTMNGVLQGMGKVFVPVKALAAGATVKIILSYWLIGIPAINIYGAPISTFACYMVAALVDVVMVKKITGVKFGFVECILRPSLASLFMGISAWGVNSLLYNYINKSLATLIAVLVAFFVFVLCIPIFKVLSRTEIMGLPGGEKMVILYNKISGETV